MVTSNDFNMIEVLRQRLEIEVKKKITEELVSQELARYEKRLRTTIKDTVDKVTFDGIESMRDMLQARDELHVYLHWKEEEGSDTRVMK